jgi:cyclophilin family peptidyl-prolyl cis-trans isomerase
MVAIPALLLGLTLSVAPVKPEVTLGEPVQFTMTLTNDGASERVPTLALDQRSAALWLESRGQSFVLVHRAERAPETKEIKRGETWTDTLEWTPVRAGEYDFDAHYAATTTANVTIHKTEVRIHVKPAANGATELGWRLETTKGAMTVHFLPEAAPNHVAHFADLARRGFFDGLTFHRVIKGFMAQGGDPLGTGEGGPGYTLPAEFSTEARFKHAPGRVSTARDEDPDTGGSQFFVCFKDVPRLDGKYTVFGELLDGTDTLRAIEAIGAEPDPKDPTGKPSEIVKITKSSLVPIPPAARDGENGARPEGRAGR